MTTVNVYNTARWGLARSRALSRDGNRCTVARLLGGECSASLDVHHIRPVSGGGQLYALVNLATVCDSHHPAWEALRRRLLAAQSPVEERPPRCQHFHPTAEARAQCEARMARRRATALA